MTDYFSVPTYRGIKLPSLNCAFLNEEWFLEGPGLDSQIGWVPIELLHPGARLWWPTPSLINQMLFIKKSSQQLKRSINYGSNDSIRNSPIKRKEKCKKWHKLFCHRVPDEEEFTLLPILNPKKHIVATTLSDDDNDWWLKYLRSDIWKIYESELENQAEFSKFRDWCSSIKLYNGKKTGILEKDEQLYCGILKAGIALYRWPPTANTVAVTDTGVDLNKG
ncbi:jg27389, partial [Pararge aegeria aegeria]